MCVSDDLFLHERKSISRAKIRVRRPRGTGRKGSCEGPWKAHLCFLWILEFGFLALEVGDRRRDRRCTCDGNMGIFCWRAGAGGCVGVL